jgi:pyruvate/2-oxoglutarate/acetoin dehydrogenase E1 component
LRTLLTAPQGTPAASSRAGTVAASALPTQSWTLTSSSSRRRRAGTDVTVVASLIMLHHALAAAEALAADGVSVEVVDPRTLVPLDGETIVDSVRKTGRLLVVDEAYLTCGIQAEVIALVTERAFGALRTAPRRLGNPGVPVPFSPPLEAAVLPGPTEIAAAIRDMLAG